jgi:dTDP-4-amino-4,6-dideoxygalactose transaminase
MTDASAPVPFVDLGLQHRRIADEVQTAIASVLDRTAFVLAAEVEQFEREYAEYCGAAHCVGVGNGTDAVELALRAVGIGPGDDVLIPANTFVATAEAVLRAGANLVLADCDDSYLLDPASVAERITPRTRAVIAVHLYGQMASMKEIQSVVPSEVMLIEDAAQSQGALQDGRRSGSFGSAAGTSFYPGKNLGAYGDAGAVTTDSAEVAERLRALRNHGGVRKYEHVLVGTNSRLDSIQAAVLSIKLARLDAWNAERREAAVRYAELLAGVDGVVLPQVAPGNEHVWHLYVVRVAERDRVSQSLGEAGIGAGIHYPAPVHLLPAFSGLGIGVGEFPAAERFGGEILSLPMFPGVTAEQQERVVAALRTAMRH